MRDEFINKTGYLHYEKTVGILLSCYKKGRFRICCVNKKTGGEER